MQTLTQNLMHTAYRGALPQLDGSLWLTDGGIETTLIFREGIELPDFAAFHGELNESTSLDAGDPVELGGQYAALKHRLPQLNVLGGCCGTDHRHVEHMALACKPLF